MFAAEVSDVACLLWLFRHGRSLAANPFFRPPQYFEHFGLKENEVTPYLGEGRFTPCKMLAQLLLQKNFEWHDWSESATRHFCENPTALVTGCGTSSKSTSAGWYCICFLSCAPHDSAVLVASTTIENAKKRIWREIYRFYSILHRRFGGWFGSSLVTSPRPRIRSAPQDESHGIFVIPLAKGEEEKGINDMKGFHPKRILTVADELDSVNSAVWDVQTNLASGTVEHGFIGLGNKPSMFNPLGQLMDPVEGWPKIINTDADAWVSKKGFPCLRFDAWKSPNIRDNNKWSGIVRAQDIDTAVKNAGGNPNSARIWIDLKGLCPPEGTEDTILSEAALRRWNCMESVIWAGRYVLSALLDPAFGGDRCIFRTMARGRDIDNRMRVCFMETITIPIDANNKDTPPEYQIARRVMELCKGRQIPPAEFIGDATGTGRGALNVLKREWSPAINECEFGGAPSDMIVSEENPKPARQEYDRRITELYFAFREFVQADMIRGLDGDTAQEFCQRHFEIKGSGDGKRYSVEKKADWKKRGLPSPDLSDCAVTGIELLRRKGVNASIQTTVKSAYQKEHAQNLDDYDSDGQADNYTSDYE